MKDTTIALTEAISSALSFNSSTPSNVKLFSCECYTANILRFPENYEQNQMSTPLWHEEYQLFASDIFHGTSGGMKHKMRSLLMVSEEYCQDLPYLSDIGLYLTASKQITVYAVNFHINEKATACFTTTT